MHDNMQNDAIRRKPDASHKTLTGAFRHASGWRENGSTLSPTPGAPNAAYVTASAQTTATKDTEKKGGKTGGTKKKQLSDVECYVCEEKGHCAKDCLQRKSSSGKVHVSVDELEADDESEHDKWGVALVSYVERCCFSR